MFFQRLPDYPLANLFHSDDSVAVGQLTPEPLKDAIIDLLNRGQRHLVLEAADGFWLVAVAAPVHEGNLVGTIRRWQRELGQEFFIKPSNSEFETPTPNSFLLPNGRIVEVRSILVRPQNFTCWGLSTLKALPPNYIKI